MTKTMEPMDEMQETSPGGSFSLQVFWRHKLLILLGVAIAMGIASFQYARQVPIYQSSAKVLIIKKQPDTPLQGIGGSGSHLDESLAFHKDFIKSPLIVGKAVEKGQLGSLPSFADQGNPTGAILGGLEVTPGPSTGASIILNLSYRSRMPDDCGAVLNAIIESYNEYLESKYQNINAEMVKLITEMKDLLETKLVEKEQKYQQFRIENPLVWTGKDGLSPQQERLFAIEAKRSASRLRQAELQARLAGIEHLIKQGGSQAELLAIVAKATTEERKEMSLTDPLVMLHLRKQRLLKEGYGAGHPDIMVLDEEMEYLKTPNKLLSLLEKDGKKNPVDPVKAYTEALQRELDESKRSEKVLDKILQDEQDAAKKLIGYEILDRGYRTEIARINQAFEAVVKRLQEISLVRNFGGYDAQILSPAGMGWRVGNNPMPIFAVAGFLGLLAGMGLAYFAEMADQSFRTPEEIRRQLGLAVVGHVPHIDEEEARERAKAVDANSGMGPLLCTYYHPKSREAEAYRAIRTSLYFSTHGEGHKVIQITSPEQGDGKTTLAANLAISIAQSGKRVLLIDADLRRPRVHRLFGVSSKIGLTSVLIGERELPDAVQPTPVPNLTLLLSGAMAPNPAELISQPHFHELLNYIREQYDYVIVDTPPLLAVTDPCVVVPYVDGVVLTIRLTKNARPQAIRAREILATLGATVVGIVVNDVGEQAAGGYGYGSGYGYGYGYGYGAGYYAEDEESVEASQNPQESATVKSDVASNVGTAPMPGAAIADLDAGEKAKDDSAR